MTAGKLACLYCMENSKAFTLKHGRKNTWFDCHHQFLPMDHEFRKMKNAFRKNKVESEPPPPLLTGHQIWERVSQLPKVTEASPSRLPGYGVEHNWTKQSIFWELSYWKDNLLRHNLDVMHIEKNYFDNLFNTVMDVNVGSKFEDAERLCFEFRKEADMNEGRLIGMKSHDCHVFMETLIPIAFSHLPERIWKPITEISHFFRDLCSGKLLESSLDWMEENILVTTTKLEKIFPCGFFDVTEHLPIHLVQEARFGGPVQTRWMISWPNRNDEGNSDPLFPPISIFNQNGRGSKKHGKRGFTDMEMQSAVSHVLLNCLEIQSYVKNKKTNNSSVYIQGDADGTSQTIEYYGVIQEIIEVRYSGWPKKKIVLFRCEWFDPSHRGTKMDHQHNIIEVKHTRKYRSYDPFIIAQNAKQLYYASYLLRRDKADWWVVIKSKPVGRIEIDNVLDVAYQNDLAIVQQEVDVELETTLQHLQHILEEVSDDDILNVEEEISENEENESFDDKELDDNENETTEEEDWENDGIETSEEE
ncbi:hypothetical protein RDI58_010495 [Solanum bulbocastanum]|uniref:DUF4216 domain-containing protein n=1 Tax=Solanum bulbocastanum TaxID=147425 RepID=A0AAN8TPJ2_SOLBU